MSFNEFCIAVWILVVAIHKRHINESPAFAECFLAVVVVDVIVLAKPSVVHSMQVWSSV